MKIMLLGDISPTEFTAPYFEREDLSALFGDALSLFKGNDLTFANLECAVTQSEEPIEKFGPNLKAPRATARVLKRTGIDLLGLSNNHIFDFGIKGYQDTIDALEQAGLSYTGFGKNYEDSRKNYSFEKDGERICLIAVCEHEYSYALEDRMGSRPYDEYDTLEDIRNAKGENDRVIVLYHGGKEYCPYPSPRLYRACRAMARSGADVVLCQHTHCISCYEEYNGCHILYGQGNFHFIEPDDPNPPCWNSLLAVKYDTVANRIAFVPIVTLENGITLAKGKEKEEIMDGFAQRNLSLKTGEWKKHWHAFCESLRQEYTDVIRKACNEDSSETANAHFGHYLDCEAHTDVWRELFPTYNHTNERSV